MGQTQQSMAAPPESLKNAAAAFEAGDLATAERLVGPLLLEEAPRLDALHLAGLIALRQGRPSLAVERLGACVGLAPERPELHLHLGNAYREAGAFAAAHTAYAEAERQVPALPGLRLNRTLLLEAEGRFEEALESAERLMAAEPQAAVGAVRKASILQSLGRFRDLAAFAHTAAARYPRVGRLPALEADAHERLGDLDAAEAAARKALALNPRLPGALKSLASVLRRRGETEEAAAFAKRTLDALPEEAPGRRALYGELGLALDRLGEPQRAFEAFTQMNCIAGREAERKGISPSAYLDQVETIRKAFEGGLATDWANLPPPQADGPPPVFLVGFPRSGTTLLDQVLDAHPEVDVLEERPVLLPVRDRLRATPEGYPARLASLTVDERESLRRLYAEALTAEGLEPHRRIIVNKLPLNIIHVGLVARVFPDARFILALRHPADSVLSCFMQDFALNASMANFLSLDGAAHLYDRVMGLWLGAQTWLANPVATVRYEDLTEDLEGAVRPVMEMLALDWDAAMADPAAHARRRGTIRTPSYAQVTEPLYRRSVARWERYRFALDPVLPRLAPYITAFGYDVSADHSVLNSV